MPKQQQSKKKKPKTLNRKLAAMQIAPEVYIHVDIGGEQKTVRIAMDTADPDELGMVKIAEDDNSEFWIRLQSKRQWLLLKEIEDLKKHL